MIDPEVLVEERHELREPPVYVFRVNRREFLGVGLLFVAASGLDAQRGGFSGTPPSTLDARLHIGEDGAVTVLTGKVEEGQGPRTEFAMAAAEELGLPLDQVRVQMADTDRVPNDGTTAGSGSTPRTMPQIRRAAAAARQLLEEASAKQGRKLAYKDLVKSPELSKAIPTEVKLKAASEWKTMGTPQHRTNSRDLVTGSHKFPSDVQRPGMLYGAVLRPVSYGAKLASVDLEAAKKRGAVAVRDGEFVGVAAATSYDARKALEAMAPSWKEPGGPSSVGLYDYLKEHASASARPGQSRGDVDAALAGASSKKMSAVYTAAYVAHAPMEPRAAVAEWQDGKLTVWTGTSGPFAVREALAQAFHIQPSQVRVIVPDFGGGFGGKHTGEAAIEAARLAKEAGKAVSLRWTRAEEFAWAYFRPAARIEVSAALDASNGIAAWDFVNYNSGASAIEAPYKTGASRTRYVPSESPLRIGSYRALASTANNFARECFIDELAFSAGVDALEYRLKHLSDERIRAVLMAAAEKFKWASRSKGNVGLACGVEKNSVVAACVEVAVDAKTGVPRLLEIVQAYECGKIVNPAGLKAQVEGCILMGLGAALREEMHFDAGRLRNGRFSGYRVTRFRDVPPKMDIVLVDRKDAEPVGAGETPIIAVAPAMANAMFRVTGKRVRGMPLRG